MTNKLLHLDPITVKSTILNEMIDAVGRNLLEKWYPLTIDYNNGGYYTNLTYNWKIEPEHPKMIVTQGRQVWTAAKAAIFFDNELYAHAAIHGFEFLKKSMWDQEFGGFYQMRGYNGKTTEYLGFCDEKRTYGNAFAVFGLSALYELTKDNDVLEFAKEAFHWIETHAFDSKFKGYYQFLTREGKVFNSNSNYKTKAYDAMEQDYKDQNTSIHLLEGYTELFNIWPDDLLREKLLGLLILIRDVITTPKGHMNLFFDYDWKPVSFKDAKKEIRDKNFWLDHVSFGHDYETAFLMLEASYALGLKNDFETMTVAKRMLDHAIVNGWDNENGGFFDRAYYFPNENQCTIIQSTKNWWAQAEALNMLLIMSKIFPGNRIYHDYFLKQWDYIKRFLLDYENGDWFEGGLDQEPHLKNGGKGHIWKAAYHTSRSLMNCIYLLTLEQPKPVFLNKRFEENVQHFNQFISHWESTAGVLTK